MYFELLGPIVHIETFAVGSRIREVAGLRKLYGKGRWRKRKGIAKVRLIDGTVQLVEVHCMKQRELVGKYARSNDSCEAH